MTKEEYVTLYLKNHSEDDEYFKRLPKWAKHDCAEESYKRAVERYGIEAVANWSHNI